MYAISLAFLSSFRLQEEVVVAAGAGAGAGAAGAAAAAVVCIIALGLAVSRGSLCKHRATEIFENSWVLLFSVVLLPFRVWG